MHLPTSTAVRLICATALACAAALAFAGGVAVATAASPATPSAGTVATASSPATPSAGTVASSPGCASTGLVVWLDTQGNGTAGSVYYSLQLTNLSGRACTLRGYPGVSAVDLRGRQLGSAAAHDTAKAPKLIKLAAGATAIATLRIVDAGNFPSSACRQVTAAGLRVYPPNQTASKLVPFPFAACSKAGPDYLTVRVAEHG